jgi:ribonuclease G
VSVDLIIDSSPTEVTIAVLKDKRLIELHKEKKDSSFSVGDIYLGKVKKIMPGLNAAFVDVGYEKDAFLHYHDLGPQFRSLSKFVKLTIDRKQTVSNLLYFNFEKEIDKNGKMEDVMSNGYQVMVQITKEPISTKGPRLTSEISLAGRYLVLVPFSERISVSQKIDSREEKDRLKRLIKSIKPKGFGVIIRTVAEGKKVADLHNDMNDLVAKWDRTFEGLRKAKPRQKLLGELNKTSALLRDVLNASFSSIHVNDDETFLEVKEFIKNHAPEKEKILSRYQRSIPIFDHFGIEKQIKASFGKNVTMKSGAYLVIEHTEALHVIDVNSGQKSRSEKNQEQNALEVNLEAAEEIARQLRLRDMGGIIVVDFIDQRDGDNRKQLFERMKEAMSSDRAKHTILPPSKFGLIQITRQRVRPEMDIKTTEVLPSENGEMEVQATILIIDEIKNKLINLVEEGMKGPIALRVHPFVAAYLKEGFYSRRLKWSKLLKRWINVQPLVSYNLFQYDILVGGEKVSD